MVACSGGPDSLTLLHLLRFGGGHQADALVVAHFDHAMRDESRGDARWVRGLCRAWGLEWREERAAGRLRGEWAAREARWAFLERVRDEVGAVAVVTGHHADDRVETVLHNAIRGAGPRGLGGMGAGGARLKPLLGVRRDDLRRWARRRGIVARLDPSNAEPSNPRNRLRHEVIPTLESIRPGAVRGLLRTARLAASAERALRDAEDLILPGLRIRRRSGRQRVDLPALLDVPRDLRARLLRRICRDVGGALDEAGTRAAMQFTTAISGGAECRLPGGLVLRRSMGELEVARESEAAAPDRPLEIRSGTSGVGEVVVGGERWRVAWGDGLAEEAGSTCLWLDPAAFPLRVRGWRSGDRVLRDGHAVSLARLWASQRVPLHERSRRPVVEDGSGRLVWVPGSWPPSEGERAGARPLFMEVAHVDNR